MSNGFSLDQRGVEPTVMKLMAGVILLAIGLGVGISLYLTATKTAQLTFQVNASPNATTIGRPATGENWKDVSVTVERLGDYRKSVKLTASGLPLGVRVEFHPDNGIPSFGSTMRIFVDHTAALVTTTITIKATEIGGDVERAATLELTVE